MNSKRPALKRKNRRKHERAETVEKMLPSREGRPDLAARVRTQRWTSGKGPVQEKVRKPGNRRGVQGSEKPSVPKKWRVGRRREGEEHASRTAGENRQKRP